MSLTYEEIRSQPERWAETIRKLFDQKTFWAEQFRKAQYEVVYFTGCGTSYYLADTAAHFFQEKTGIYCRAFPASEIMLTSAYVISNQRRSLLIGLSRSGSTTETVKAMEIFKEGGYGDVLSISSRADSPAGKAATFSIELPHTFDNSMVMTSTFTNMLLATQLISSFVSQDEAYLTELQRLPELGAVLLDNSEALGNQLGSDLQMKQFIYLGLGSYFGLSAEAMMKLKEMTQVMTESYNPLEFRHGPLSIIEKDTMVILLANDKSSLLQQEILRDVKNFGGQTLLISDQKVECGYIDISFSLQSGLSDVSRAILHMPVVQFTAYFRALALNLNPDSPRFLNPVTIIEV